MIRRSQMNSFRVMLDLIRHKLCQNHIPVHLLVHQLRILLIQKKFSTSQSASQRSTIRNYSLRTYYSSLRREKLPNLSKIKNLFYLLSRRKIKRSMTILRGSQSQTHYSFLIHLMGRPAMLPLKIG